MVRVSERPETSSSRTNTGSGSVAVTGVPEGGVAEAEYDESVCAVFEGGLDAVLVFVDDEGEGEW